MNTLYRHFFLALFIFGCKDFLAASAPILEIDSIADVRNIPAFNDHYFGPHAVFVFDADETISQVDCMAVNWENQRQHKEAMLRAVSAFYWEAVANATPEGFIPFLTTLYSVFENQPLAYKITEDAWMPFLEEARSSEAYTIVVSSRRFKDEEPARIEFFKELGFERKDLLYARSNKADIVHDWLADKTNVTHIVFVDNLHKHCTEIMTSEKLKTYQRCAFVHNGYKHYFEAHHQAILPLQLRAANKGTRLTDAVALELWIANHEKKNV